MHVVPVPSEHSRRPAERKAKVPTPSPQFSSLAVRERATLLRYSYLQT